MFDRVLIANRGAIACRIARTLKRLGVASVAIYSVAERHASHTQAADLAVCIGPSAAEASYLNALAVLDAARVSGARALHPGHGLLSRNADFAAATERLGLVFVGPTPEQLRAFGDKQHAVELARQAGLEPAPTGLGRARHLTIPVFGDGRGRILCFPERDCSAQREGQRLLEETPAPGLDRVLRAELGAAARALAELVSYRSAGSVEFAYDSERRQFYFLDFETSLDPSHALTEAALGLDLVEWMLRAAAGEALQLADARSQPERHAIQVRLRGEDPARDFKPASGLLTAASFPNDVRVDSAVEAGSELSGQYDSLLATLVVAATERDSAIASLQRALAQVVLGGVETNQGYLAALASDPVFVAGELTTESLRRFGFAARSVEVVAPGTFSIVVDYPGRLGHWDVGIPPSGPMDDFAARVANRIVGNRESAALLELTMAGPTLRFECDTVIALAGAAMSATLDDEPVPLLKPLRVRAKQTLALGKIEGAGCRTYLALQGGLAVPHYLGSRTTFTLAGFGGHAGRALRRGDVLHLADDAVAAPEAPAPGLLPSYGQRWDIGVLYGPHGAPDFFTERDIEALFSASWQVHFNSNRTGVRLLGPKPEWARSDGGEAGLHPSNIHDVAYSVGAIDFTGDMPILLGPDGPSLGGFVCPATVVAAELWKLGQLRPGDHVRFVPITSERAAELEWAQNRAIAQLKWPERAPKLRRSTRDEAVLKELAESEQRVRVVYRQAGDKALLVEYGPLVLDLKLRFRVHALMSWLADNPLRGIIDLTPGIRSLQVHYDSRVLSTQRLLDALVRAESELPPLDDVEVPTRTVRLPLSWDDPATRLAIAKYTQSVRPDAPWCPSNIEFIRRINGLESQSDVHRIVHEARYLVLGLGDVYLGAPVATPLDPRHRLVTTKYNPARTWTPENAVGIGGAYLCIYGMEGPGGYQFVGRTLQVYNRFRSTPRFRPGSPWLLRFFDQLCFYPVGAEELLDLRERFLHGKVDIEIEPGRFRLRDYERFLAANAAEISSFKATQQRAFEAERARWVASGQLQTTKKRETSLGALT